MGSKNFCRDAEKPSDLCEVEYWGPIEALKSAKHKGPILRFQHKQNGHRSSSVALTYRFSHFADFPILRIIIWPRALSFKGINRISCMCKSELFEFSLTIMSPCFISCRTPQQTIFFIDMHYISVAAETLSFNHNMGCTLMRAVGLWYAADWDNESYRGI